LLTVYATNPTSVINLVPNPVILGSSVTLDGSRSYDSRPGGQLYFNKWVITKNSATVNTFTGPVVSWTPTSTGTYNITYTIYSGSGYTDKASANLTVTACPWYLAGDINMDCTADFSDFAILAQNWLTICQPSTSNPACTSR
jgi:hypothetical protein